MELQTPEIARLKHMIEEWLIHDERELEATFSDASDTTTFLSVAQRLKSKGYEALPQEDKLNIITPEQVRFTITGLGMITEYCKDDTLAGKPFSAMVKDRAGQESNIDLDEYGVRVKVRREKNLEKTDPAVGELLGRWDAQPKAFRILRRWTFVGKGVRFDLSMVRTTPKNAKGDFKWQTQFSQRDIMKEPAHYEIEVELDRPSLSAAPSEEERKEAGEKALKQLIAGVGEILRGIQKHPFLIRKSIARRALDGYKDLVKTDRFRGVAPITMEKENMIKERRDKVPNIRDGYNVTDKADGLRMMGYVDSKGELFMIDMSLQIYRTGLQRIACSNSLVDGEYVTRDKDDNPISQFLLFDIYISPDKNDVSAKPFYIDGDENTRHGELMKWVSKWNDGDGPKIVQGAGVTDRTKIMVQAKKFMFAKAGSDTEIFQACARILDSEAASEYHRDGLILTPNGLGLPEKPGIGFEAQLKWKPADENTVDFLVIIDKDIETRRDAVNIGVKPGSGETVTYKTIHLYVGSELDPAYEDPRGTVLFEQPLPGVRGKNPRKRDYKPVLFNPKELPDTMANVSYLEVERDPASGDDYIRCENDDPIVDKSIVEYRYEAKNEPGWRWIPMRVRYDKTERFQKGIIGRTLNKDTSAEGVWNSIHDPITYHMIRTGSETPSGKEIEEMSAHMAGVVKGEVAKVYYERKAAKEDIQLIKGLRDFHRVYIKENLLLDRGLKGGGKTLVDLACGQGGDIWSWIRMKTNFVYGTDIAGNGIRDPQNGAYRRYLNAVMKYGGYDSIGKMIFTIGSSAKILSTGEAGATPEEANIMRAVYGRLAPDGPIPPFVEKNGAKMLREGADCVAIMFAIHYFFESEASLNGLLQNISDSLKVGGLFIGCCFDGQKVFDALRPYEEGATLVGREKEVDIWKITKKYSNMDLTNDNRSIGMPIDVEFISIGTEQREYLVPFELLKAKMSEIGCDLLTDEECKQLNLVKSTNLFEETYDMAMKKGEKFPMSNAVKQYSFFNRWFIFKRRRGGPLLAEEVGSQREPSSLGEEEKEIKTLVAEPTGVKEVAVKPAAAIEVAKGPLKIFQFFSGSEKVDRLKIKDPEAAKWMSPTSYFPIKDEEAGIEYPTIEHYVAAMKYKLASTKPELSESIFSKTGILHQEYLRNRDAATGQGSKGISDQKEMELQKEEIAKVKEELKSNKKYRAVFDEGKWLAVKDKVFEDAVTYRYTHDARLRKILEAAKNQGYTLVYYTQGGLTEWSGKKTSDGKIEGQNKLGNLYMKLAGFRV